MDRHLQEPHLGKDHHVVNFGRMSSQDIQELGGGKGTYKKTCFLEWSKLQSTSLHFTSLHLKQEGEEDFSQADLIESNRIESDLTTVLQTLDLWTTTMPYWFYCIRIDCVAYTTMTKHTHTYTHILQMYIPGCIWSSLLLMMMMMLLLLLISRSKFFKRRKIKDTITHYVSTGGKVDR